MPLTVNWPKLQEAIQKSGKVLSNIANNIVNPAYNLTTSILIGFYHFSMSAITVPIVGGVFALLSILLESVITFADKRRTLKEKLLFLAVMIVAGTFAGLIFAYFGTNGALIIGLVGAAIMTSLQLFDLFSQITTYRKRKESLKSKEQLLNALNNEKCHDLPLTENMHKWAIIYSKMVNLEKSFSGLKDADKKHYEHLDEQLDTYLKRFYSIKADTTEVNFDEPTKIFDFLTLNILGSDKKAKNNILKALKEDDPFSLKYTKKNYKWATIFLKIVQREKNCSYFNGVKTKAYDELEKNLKYILKRFDDQSNLDFDKNEVLCDENDLESLFKKRQDEYDNTTPDQRKILALDKKIARITIPFDRGDYKLKQSEIKIAYAVCDLFLALLGVTLACLGFTVAFSLVAPAAIPTTILGIGIAVAVVTILRGGSKLSIDMFKKWRDSQKKQEDIKKIDEYITNPLVRPYDSDFYMLHVFSKANITPKISGSISLDPKTLTNPLATLDTNPAAEVQAPSLEITEEGLERLRPTVSLN